MTKKKINKEEERLRSSFVLKTAEKNFSTVYNSMSEGLALHEIIYSKTNKAVDYVITDINPAYEKIIGLKRSAIIGLKATKAYSVKEAPYLDIYSEVVSTGRPLTFETYFPPMEKHFNISAFSPGKGRFGVVFQDITDRKRTEKVLLESEERLKIALDSVQLGTWDLDLVTGNAIHSLRHDQIFGYRDLQSEWTFEIACRHMLPEYEPLFREAFVKATKTGILKFEGKVLWQDGSIHWIAPHGVVHYNKEGQPVRAIGVVEDITDRKETELALRKSEAWLSASISSMATGIILYGPDTKAVHMNETARKLLPEELFFNSSIEERMRIINWKTETGNPFPPEDIPVKRAFKGETTNNIILCASFHERNLWISANAAPILSTDGKIIGVVSSFLDITENKNAEIALRMSEERLRVTLASIGDAVMSFDTFGRVVFLNPVATKLTGWSQEDAKGQPVEKVFRIVNELTRNPAEDIVSRVLKEGKVIALANHTALISKDGFQIPIEDSAAPILDRHGIISGVVLVFHDVTQKRLAHEALKESEEKLWSVLNATQESIYMFDREGIITMSNRVGLERKQSVDQAELVGHHFSEFLPVPVAKTRQTKLNEVFKTGKPLEFEDERDEKLYHHNFFPVFKNNNVSYVVNYSTDITERKKAADKLKESEERFRTIAESLPVQISISRISDATIRFTNEAYDNVFGYEKGALLGTKVRDLYFNPEDRTSVIEKLNKDGLIDDMEVQVRRSDGSSFWIIMSLRIIIFEGEPAYLNAFVDISDTKKTQERLLQVNRTLNAHSRSSKVMMHAKNEIDYLNQVCNIINHDCGHRMVWIGYAQNDRKKSVKPIVHCGLDMGYIETLNISWADNELGRGPTGTAIRTGNPSMCRNIHTDPAFEPWREAAIKRGYASSLVLPFTIDGKPFGAVSIYSKEPDPFSESEVELLSDLVNDLAYGISFLRLEESERAATKIIRENEAKLKELIATKDKFFNIVAHDLKNPFTSMLGSSELLYDHIEGMSTQNIKKLALILNDSAKGGYSILLNLLDWSRSQTGQLKIIPREIILKELIDENISNLQLPATVKEISIIYESADDIILTADKNMLNTILRNLLSNALKYTNKKGRVVISTQSKPDYITILIKDNGVGIPKDRIDKLFKLDIKNSMPGTENEQGTGLGLKLCKEFVEMHGGTIQVESDEGKGSTFSFTIPAKHE